jgi:DNA-binding beta-propeller fold protein YncE
VRALGVLVLAGALGACTEEVRFAVDDPWSESSAWPGVGAGKVLVTNSGDDTLSLLDPQTLAPLFRAPTGRIPAEREGPHHATATPDGRAFFVGISNFVPGSGSGPHGSHGNGTVDGYLLGYDAATGRLLDEVRVDRSPGDVRITPNGRLVVQTHFDLQSILDAVMRGDDPRAVWSRLAVIDPATMTRVAMIPVCPAAHGVAPSADGLVAYVSCWGSDELAVVSLADPITEDSAVERFPVGPGGGDPTSPTYGPYAATVAPDGTVWVSNLEGRSVAVFDAASRAVTDRIPLPGSPFFGAFSPDGAAFYLPVQNPDALVIIDTTTQAVAQHAFEAGTCRAPHGSLLLPNGELAVVCEGDRVAPGTVVRLDVDAFPPRQLAHHEVGVYPDDLVLLAGDE